MKDIKLVILTLGMMLFCVLSCNNDENNENNNNPDSNNTTLNNTNFENQNFEIPSELIYTREGQAFIYDKIYPIGWSKDGKFAYITEPADEGSGFYWFEIVILDIVNNTINWSWKPKNSEEGNLKSSWKENYEMFAQHLNEAEIVQTKNFELKQTKSSYKGNDYELVLETKTVIDPEYGYDIVKEIQINIISPELGVKQFHNEKIDELSYVVSAYIPGYILSPYDDRIVIICKKERPGYEGPPNVVYFDLIGTNLTTGFKKEKEG